ncbi:Purine nucleoside phosphorylase OS=Streptomyces fumanus OX=67302 GN=GCM10018772_42250 PE=3 SV=1 [Streptomyces fumanus]
MDALGTPEAELQVTDLPGFPQPVVAGHGGKVRSYRLGDRRALVFLGRTHYYEGHGVAAVAHGVRTAVAAGAKTVIRTRTGAGGCARGWRPGQPVLISDHINLTATSPIVGANFVRPDRPVLAAGLRALCKEVDPSLEEGVYAQFPGPHYETPAEIRMARVIGADLVGMSTVLEAIAAREAGAEVGIPPATNLAAGMTGEPLNHEEVLQAGRDSAARMGSLLAQVLGRL